MIVGNDVKDLSATGASNTVTTCIGQTMVQEITIRWYEDKTF